MAVVVVFGCGCGYCFLLWLLSMVVVVVVFGCGCCFWLWLLFLVVAFVFGCCCCCFSNISGSNGYRIVVY